MLDVLDARRRQLWEGLGRCGGVQMTWPQASYLAWVNLPMLGDDPAAVLLEQGSLAVNSGLAFGSVGEGHARINFATSEAILEEIITRVGSIVDAHSS
jgi:cystathionine beta-lyase